MLPLNPFKEAQLSSFYIECVLQTVFLHKTYKLVPLKIFYFLHLYFFITEWRNLWKFLITKNKKNWNCCCLRYKPQSVWCAVIFCEGRKCKKYWRLVEYFLATSFLCWFRISSWMVLFRGDLLLILNLHTTLYLHDGSNVSRVYCEARWLTFFFALYSLFMLLWQQVFF